jgi:chromosome segregation ATPase
MTTEETGSSLKDAGYRSPKRCLALAFHKSREAWKKKAQHRNEKIKVLKVRVYDLEQSRQRHCEQAQQAREALQQMEQKVDQLQAEMQQLRAQGAELAGVVGGKKH